jgi:hypothetical protein
MKTPTLLASSKIDPFANNNHTLSNSKYDNIYILGNVVGNIYSESSISEMSKIIAQNVSLGVNGVRKRVSYKGSSSFSLWLSDTECMQIQTDYNTLQVKSVYGRSKFMRNLVAKYQEAYLRVIGKRSINHTWPSLWILEKPPLATIADSQVLKPAKKEH